MKKYSIARAGSHRLATLRPLVAALMGVGFLGSAWAAANLPQGAVVEGGSVGFSTLNQRMTITQGTPRAIVRWQDFSIGAGFGVNVVQPSAASVLLNRVNTGVASDIAGALTANGRVFIVNPAGVMFGAGSQVNVGGLVASTLALSTPDAAFMGGTERFEFAVARSSADVWNEGLLAASPGGTVALIGASITNDGRIAAPGGTAALAAGERVVLDFGGDGLTQVVVSAGTLQQSAQIYHSGEIQADGGRVALHAVGDNAGIYSTGVLRADSVAVRNGEIVLESRGSNVEGGVLLQGGALYARGQSAGQSGGRIDIRSERVAVGDAPGESESQPVLIDASGVAGGGHVDVRAQAVAGEPDSGALYVGPLATLQANGLGSGRGGRVDLLADRTLRAFGQVQARGGAQGGDGGTVETSSALAVPAGESDAGLDLRGLRVDASAPAGRAGTWKIDPYDIEIVNGAATGSLAGGWYFDPVGNSKIQDSQINNALNGGTNVTITTGKGGSDLDGNIFLNNARILYTGAGERSLRFEANRSVRSNPGTVIASVGGPLSVALVADALGAGLATGGGQVSFSGALYSNGGAVDMSGRWANPSNFGCSVCLESAVVDTRQGNLAQGAGFTGGSNAGAGGAVTLVGRTLGSGAAGQPALGAVAVASNARIDSASGDITVFGSSGFTHGVSIAAQQGGSVLTSTTGTIRITGVASQTTPGGAAVQGVLINGAGGPAQVQSGTGDIEIVGVRLPDATGGGTSGAGVALLGGAAVNSSAGGQVRVSGESRVGDAGVRIAGTGSQVSGSGGVVLRAHSTSAGADALVIDTGAQVSSAQVLNVRPGGVDVQGGAEDYSAVAVDRAAIPIALGASSAAGFALSDAELSRLGAPTLVVGSDAHAGAITVAGAINRSGALTLQNQGSGDTGGIAINAPISVDALGLASGGTVAQSAAGAITAQTLLARSERESVRLDRAANNVSAGALGGSAAKDFRYQDVDALRLGNVSVTGFNAAGNQPQTLSATSTQADTVFVRTLAGDLSLATDVSSSTAADLVAGGLFQNLGSHRITGAPWRVWASSWTGESRGGMAGTGALPNLYNCSYGGPCGVSVSLADSHFIYTEQPQATVTIASGERTVGQANPALSYTLNGLVLGDTGAGITGTLSTPAQADSPAGSYPINGSFTSAEGYGVRVVPGTLNVRPPPTDPPTNPPTDPPTNPPTDPPMVDSTAASRLRNAWRQVLDRGVQSVDLLREIPNTYTFDRNLNAVPVCFATDRLAADRVLPGEDTLSREWSRVRSRPNLTQCIDTGREDGCGDF